MELGKILCVFISAMLHDFSLGSRFFAKCQNCNLGGDLGGDLGGNLGGILRPDLFHRNRGKRNHGAEHIALDKLRGPAGIELRVFVSIPHPGPSSSASPISRNTLEMGGFLAYGSKEDRCRAPCPWERLAFSV